MLPIVALLIGRLITDRFGSGRSGADTRWYRANQRWEQLFYCGRCDGVFVPGDIGLVPARQMREYLAAE
jgi:hypothetical protein